MGCAHFPAPELAVWGPVLPTPLHPPRTRPSSYTWALLFCTNCNQADLPACILALARIRCGLWADGFSEPSCPTYDIGKNSVYHLQWLSSEVTCVKPLGGSWHAVGTQKMLGIIFCEEVALRM